MLTKILYSALFLTVWPVAVSAGWEDHAPESINGFTNPTCDVHHNSGGRRIVRIGATAIAICPQNGGEHTYRKVDGDESWERIDTDGSYSGCLITGKDSMVYHFYAMRSGTNVTTLNMVRFKYDQTPPAPVVIYAPQAVSQIVTNEGQYHMLNAIVDSSGKLYVSSHWDNPDRVYVISSSDNGNTWEGPFQISTASTYHCFYPHLEVNRENILFAAYKEWGGNDIIKCGRSTDGGQTWTVTSLPSDGYSHYNPGLLTLGGDTLFICAQRQMRGVYGIFSFDQGATWQSWIQIEATADYGDPSPARAENGALFVAFRGDRNRSSGDYRSRLTCSQNNGVTWSAVDSFYSAPYKVGCRSQIRYQTWWNYGGPLEWIWMQRNSSDLGTDIWYDKNDDVRIMDLQADSTATRVFGSAAVSAGGAMITVCPNPFNPSTRIIVSGQFVSQSGRTAGGKTIVLEIFDIHGKLVETLFTAPPAAGQSSTGIAWDASRFPSGVYIVRAQEGCMVVSKTMTLMR